MLIHVHLKGCYDWKPMDRQPTEAELESVKEGKNRKIKVSHDGKWLERYDKKVETYTQVGIPEQQLTDLIQWQALHEVEWTRLRAAAFMLEEKTMPHHAHLSDWKWIEVHDDPEAQAYLNNYFGRKVPKEHKP